MTAVTPPWVIQASSHPADVFRRAIAFAGMGQQGVRSWVSGDLAVAQNGTPNMSVNVAAGQALINGTQNTTSQGAYEVLNDATVNLAIAASDPTNPRIDIVVAQVRDAAYSGANNDWLLAVVTGTPAGSPSPPATPANAIVLAQVAVAANATSITSGNITDKRPIFGSLYHAEVYQTNAQTMANGATTVIAYDTIEGDPNGNVTTGASFHYTVPVAGRIRVHAVCAFGAALSGNPSLDVYKNGSLAKVVFQVTSGALALPGSAEIRCAAGDTLDVRLFHNTGSGQNTNPGATNVWAEFEWVGPS